MNFRLTKTSALLLILAAGFGACKDSGNDGSAAVSVETATDIQAYFDLDTGTAVADSASSQWDIGFSGTTILANSENGGGILLLNADFDAVTEAPTEGFGAATDPGAWYTYTGEAPSGPQHAILAKENITLIVKSPDGNYSKVKILSYYEGNPDTSTDEFADFMTRPASGYYTFEYATQTNGSADFE